MKYKLKDLGEIFTGNTPSKSNAEFYKSKDIGFVKPDILIDGIINENLNVNEYISERARKKARIVQAGAIFVTCIGSIGKIGIADKELAFNQQINAILPNEKVYPKYLAYCMLQNKKKLQAIANAPIVPIINKSQFGEIDIEIEENKEKQSQIIEILEEVSSAIEKRRKQLQQMDKLVESRFIEMFGDPLSNEMCWEQVSLSVCIESIDNGKSFVCDSEAREGDWPAVLKLSAATYGYYRPGENKAMFDKNQFIEDAAVRAGDLLFTRKNTPELVGMCTYVYDTPSKLMMPDLIFRLNTNKRCNKIFLWKLINHNLFRNCIQAIANGSAKSMSNISKERLLGLKIILPPIKLQEQFAAFVAQTDKSKIVVQKALDETQLLFDSLMQKYFG